MENPALQTVLSSSLQLGSAPIRELRANTARYAPFTGDRAPVEPLIDTLIFDAALGKY
jgi:hypothetical protein